MDYEEIKRLMDDMGESKLTAIDIEFPDGIKISMKKENNIQKEETVKLAEVPTAQVNVNTQNQTTIQPEQIETKECKTIKSPMVGTFYSKSSPTAKPYVGVGSIVKKGDIVCVVEAMKLMNEIEADVEGEITEICVNDGDIVDYGKVLFKIK